MMEQVLIQNFYASGSRRLSPFVKIMQSFILLQNTEKRDWIGGGEIFGALFSQKWTFWPI